MEKKYFRIRKLYFFIALVLTLVLLVGIYYVNAKPHLSKYTTYIPFVGKIFNIKSEDVSKVELVSYPTKFTVSYTPQDEEFHQIIDALNDFRYKYWFPDTCYGLRTGAEVVGSSMRIVLTIKGEKIEVPYSSNMVFSNEIYYFSEDFDRIRHLQLLLMKAQNPNFIPDRVE